MLKQILVLSLVISATGAQAENWEAAEAEYNETYLQVENCFAGVATDREACVMSGIQACVTDLEAVIEGKGFGVPTGAGLSPDEYCNYIGHDRSDAYLNSVYQRVLKQGPSMPSLNEGAIETLRAAQRLWLDYANEMCSEQNIVGWHMGGSGWGAVTSECMTRLSIQQAMQLDRYFTIND